MAERRTWVIGAQQRCQKWRCALPPPRSTPAERGSSRHGPGLLPAPRVHARAHVSPRAICRWLVLTHLNAARVRDFQRDARGLLHGFAHAVAPRGKTRQQSPILRGNEHAAQQVVAGKQPQCTYASAQHIAALSLVNIRALCGSHVESVVACECAWVRCFVKAYLFCHARFQCGLSSLNHLARLT